MAKIDVILKRGESLQPLAGDLFDMLDSEGVLYVVADTKKLSSKYSKKQRGSLHLWCEFCAKVLNDNNLECEIINPITKVQYSMPWTMNLFKENVYKYVLEALTGKNSTEDQDSIEPSKIAEIIHKRYAENGVTLPDWPSNDSLMFNQIYP